MNQPYGHANHPWAVVEIAGDFNQSERRGLIEAAYRSSRSGLVGLALHGVTRQAVDRVLDGIVDARNGELEGVIYIDDESALLDAAARARLVIAATASFRAQLGARGIVAVGVREGTSFLGLSAGDDRAIAAVPA